jgi:23S rRNA pseudouridine1911/1915/1917 synthase
VSDIERETVRGVVSAEQDGMRVDRFIGEILAPFPRSQLKSRDVVIRIDGHPAKPSHAVHRGQTVEVEYGPIPVPDLEPEEIPLPILFETDDVLVVDKPQGMVVHPARGNYRGTLASAVLHYLGTPKDQLGGASQRPGIVHRLDKDTSGVIVVAKSVAAHEALSAQFQKRRVTKTYVAITKGVPSPPKGHIEGHIRRDPHNRKRFAFDPKEGKPARTDYAVLRAERGHSLVVLHPRTGRTHQLRVHMQHLGCPILGDPLYARKSSRFPDATLMLHALSLAITLPGEEEPRTFVSPLPERFRSVVSALILWERA